MTTTVDQCVVEALATPDEWLLDDFDHRQRTSHRSGVYVRPLIALMDTHEACCWDSQSYSEHHRSHDGLSSCCGFSGADAAEWHAEPKDKVNPLVWGDTLPPSEAYLALFNCTYITNANGSIEIVSLEGNEDD